MSDVYEDLKEAFAGESQAFQKYSAFAKKAEQEGMPNIARLFRTTAAAEKLHAEGHLNSLDGVGSTAQNLKAAIAGETHEFESMYPPMLDRAQSSSHKAKRMFAYAVAAERVHAELYARALEAAERGQDLAEARFYLCPVCGHIEFGAPPATCPICNVKGEKYVEV